MAELLQSKQLVTIEEDTEVQSQTDDNNLQNIWHTSNRFFKTSFVLCCSSILLFMAGFVGTTLNGKATKMATDTVLRKTSSLISHSNDDRKLQQTGRQRDRPIEVGTLSLPVNTNPKVYSWYVERDHNIPSLDEQMKEQWTAAWTAAGYNPQILTIDDARLHDDYDEFETKVKSFFKRKMQLNSDDYENCYFRYLAMSVKGGGIMVDLDTFPGADLSLFSSGSSLVPKEFTIYCPIEASQSEQWLPSRQAGVACAVGSQSPDDWTRVAKLALWMSQMKASERHWTDFHSLLALHSGPLEEPTVKMVKNIEINEASSKPAWDTCVFRTV